jgi:phosphonate metabolism protein (transferase hexapeptide repeat family)
MSQYIARHPHDAGSGSPSRLGAYPTIHPSSVIVDSTIGAWTEIGAHTLIAESTIGDYTYTAGDNSIIYAEVGKFCSIASHVRINPGNHPMERASQHHMTYRRGLYGFGEDDAAFFEWRRAHRCVIGHDVWIGHAAVIMPGVRIDTGAVVGSGAVVTHDVEAYTIVVGVPARPLRRRFDDATIAALLRIAWWDWDHETIGARLDEMSDGAAFAARYDPSART